METITMEGVEHKIDDIECENCFNCPTKCKCGGLIHTQFGVEDRKSNYWLFYKCDKCNSTDRPL